MVTQAETKSRFSAFQHKSCYVTKSKNEGRQKTVSTRLLSIAVSWNVMFPWTKARL